MFLLKCRVFKTFFTSRRSSTSARGLFFNNGFNLFSYPIWRYILSDIHTFKDYTIFPWTRGPVKDTGVDNPEPEFRKAKRGSQPI